MHSLIRSKSQWFQLLTAAVLLGGVLQTSTPALPQSENLSSKTQTTIVNQASYTYSASGSEQPIESSSSQVVINVKSLIDPLGRITGCAGELLPDYTGFSVAVYEADPTDPTGTSLKGLVPLIKTEFPDIPGNSLPGGLAPNTENSNPFFLRNGEGGTYSFLLDPRQGQLDAGRAYILLIKPPRNSIYSERRVRVVIQSRQGDVVSYTATSLDGKPISTTDNSNSQSLTVNIKDAARLGLVFSVLDMKASICQGQEVQIVKTGDRAAAEPGDTVIYRLSVRNLANSTLNNLVVTDTLPLGFNFLPKSVRAELGGNPVQISASRNGRAITLRAEGVSLPAASTDTRQVLNIAYGAVLTPDAIRGTGENSAIVNSQRADNGRDVKDGPAVHRLRILPGIVSDCGTLIGRVFVDKNFDGEQQPGEPGIPNAVIFMDDGNRITTDANGLFSVSNVISGYRTGVLDLSSVPGYTLAPNRKFKERNSQSRLVHLQPGGLVRMNFAVTPTFQEKKHQ